MRTPKSIVHVNEDIVMQILRPKRIVAETPSSQREVQEGYDSYKNVLGFTSRTPKPSPIVDIVL